MESCWFGIDESGNETVHQHEPHYNRLQKRWKSQSYIYVNKGIINLLIPEESIRSIKEDKIIAAAFESRTIVGNKASVGEIIKVYK